VSTVIDETVLRSLFADGLSGRVPDVQLQLDKGMKFVLRMHNFFAKLFKLQETFAQEVSKLVDQEHAKQISWKRPDRMELTSQCWLSVLDSVRTMALAHEDAVKLGRGSVVVPLRSFLDSNADKVARVKTDLDMTLNSVSILRSEVEKQKKAALKAVDHLFDKDREQKTESILSSMKSLATGKTPAQKIESDLEIVEHYANLIESGNTYVRTFHARDLPILLTRTERIERRRLALIRTQLDKFAQIWVNFATQQKDCGMKFESWAMSLNPDKDVENFVTKVSSSPPLAYGGAADADDPAILFNEKDYEPFSWGIPATMDEIRKRRAVLLNLGSSVNIWKQPFQLLMDLQKDTHPTLTVPTFMFYLLEQIRNLGGIKCEGIFRLSPSLQKMNTYAAQIENGGGFEVDSKDPNIPGHLLKKWLREHPESLVPQRHYEKCLSLAKIDPMPKVEIMAIIDFLQEPHKSMVKMLMSFLVEVSHSSDKNLMDSANLAIVFAPTLLRCPSDDVFAAVTNAKYECQFVQYLIQCFDDSAPEVKPKDAFASHSDAVPESPRALLQSPIRPPPRPPKKAQMSSEKPVIPETYLAPKAPSTPKKPVTTDVPLRRSVADLVVEDPLNPSISKDLLHHDDENDGEEGQEEVKYSRHVMRSLHALQQFNAEDGEDELYDDYSYDP